LQKSTETSFDHFQVNPTRSPISSRLELSVPSTFRLLLPLSLLRHRHCSTLFLSSSPSSHITQWLPQSATCETTSSSRSQLKSPTEVCLSTQCFVRATPVANVSTVGGIYSVLKSKAQVTTAEYGSAYTLIGPLNRNSVSFRQPLYSSLRR
jgi:hypothetical protein